MHVQHGSGGRRPPGLAALPPQRCGLASRAARWPPPCVPSPAGQRLCSGLHDLKRPLVQFRGQSPASILVRPPMPGRRPAPGDAVPCTLDAVGSQAHCWPPWTPHQAAWLAGAAAGRRARSRTAAPATPHMPGACMPARIRSRSKFLCSPSSSHTPYHTSFTPSLHRPALSLVLRSQAKPLRTPFSAHRPRACHSPPLPA